MKQSFKMAGSLLGATALAAGGLMGAVPAFADAPEANVVEAADLAQEGAAATVAVEGEFSFTQEKLTGMGVFAKAAAAACASLPDYAFTCTCLQIALSTGDVELIATVQEMLADGEAETHVMGCSCASNLAGGGAVGNAEVSGVSLASVAAMVGA